MEKTLITNPNAREAKEMMAAISRYIAEIDTLREEMHRDDQTIAETSKRTDSILAEIAKLLTDLRAA